MNVLRELCSKQKGFSIVELMVAILIGLIILAGVIQVVITSKTTFMGQEEMSFIQENARYAMDVIGKDIQGAGHWGCAGANARTAIVPRIDADHSVFLSRIPLAGFEGRAAAPAELRNNIREATDSNGGAIDPDSILVRGFRGQTYLVETSSVGSLTLTETTSLGSGDFIGVTAEDCMRIGIFKASGRSADGRTLTYSSADNYIVNIKPGLDSDIICDPASGDCGPNSGYVQMYQPSASVMSYESVAYYVGNSSAFSGTPRVPALKRAVLRHDSVGGGSLIFDEEIALGVENMQILYGVALGGNTLQYVSATEVVDWGQVVSVQVNLLFRSVSPSQPTEEEHLNMLGNTFKDRFARQIVTSTFQLRNRG